MERYERWRQYYVITSYIMSLVNNLVNYPAKYHYSAKFKAKSCDFQTIRLVEGYIIC